VWDLRERRLLHGPLTAHEREVAAVHITYVNGHPDAITAGRDGRVHVWRL